MNIRHLVVFCTVFEEKSISNAAKLEYISQPAVTKIIRKIETNYNSLLFNRENNKIIPTKSGEKLYSFAKEIIEIEKMSLSVIKKSETKDSLLRIGASYTIGDYLLPNIISSYNKLHSECKFRLVISNTPKIINQLDNNEIDIALVESQFRSNSFISSVFSEDNLVIVVPPNHHLNGKREVNLSDLKNEQMIWRERESGTRIIIENELNRSGVLNNIDSFLELGSIESIKRSVEVGLGISILPKLTIANELKYGTLKVIHCKDFLLTRNLFSVKKETRFEKEEVNVFLSFLQKNQF